MSVLVTGGLGFIGSNIVTELLDNNYSIIIVDNLSNSSRKVLTNIERIINIERITNKVINFYEGDINDEYLLNSIFEENNIESVIHLAAFKSVSESIAEPLKYYNNNIGGLLSILNVMKKYHVNKFIYSSSATVYGLSLIHISEPTRQK